MDADRLSTLFRDHLPISSPGDGQWRLMFDWVDDLRVDQGVVLASFRLIRWDRAESGWTICDIKEQDVFLMEDGPEDPRLEAMITGWARALGVALHALEGKPKADWAMPCEFYDPHVLSLKRAKTADDFFEAFLGSKKRLGRFI